LLTVCRDTSAARATSTMVARPRLRPADVIVGSRW
jgi:hypothetical protein